MAHRGSWIDLDEVLALEVTEEGFDGVKLTADGFGGVLLAIEISFEVVNILRGD